MGREALRATQGDQMIRETEFEALMRIPAELRDIDERLKNWEQWSRDRMRQNHCASMEWRYLAPRIKEPDDLHASPTPYVLDALAIHRVVCGLPAKHRLLLHLHYIKKAAPQFIRRKVGVTRDGLIIEMNHARVMVRNRLRVKG